MDALSAAYDTDSGAEEGDEEPVQETRKEEGVSINAEESSSVLSRLKEKFPLNSAPSVPVRVGVRLLEYKHFRITSHFVHIAGTSRRPAEDRT